MRTGKSETNRLVACAMILDRARGRPKQSVEVENQCKNLELMLMAIWDAPREAKHAQE